MPLTNEDRKWMERRKEWTSSEDDARECIVNTAFEEMKQWGLTPRNDDRAASLEAAVIRWIIESRE